MAKNIFETIQSERTDAMKRAPLPLGLKLLSAIFSINIVITLSSRRYKASAPMR